MCFPLFSQFGGSWIYRFRIRSGPSKAREKWKAQCVYCLVSGSELKTLRFGFRTGKYTVNAVCFPSFRELGGCWIYRFRIRSGPSKIREKWKTQCVYCLFSGSGLKTLRFGFRTGKYTVNAVCFPLFVNWEGPGFTG